jgi:hypothetical protein
VATLYCGSGQRLPPRLNALLEDEDDDEYEDE